MKLINNMLGQIQTVAIAEAMVCSPVSARLTPRSPADTVAPGEKGGSSSCSQRRPERALQSMMRSPAARLTMIQSQP
jgi:hypothetical protein